MLLTLAGIVAVFATVASWNIRRQGYALFYASAVRSMSTSWRALFFGAFDPSATMTLDKLAGFLVPQALAVRLFGFHPWALALPQVVEGVVTILACYLIGLRWRGARVGLLAAAAAAATPLFASMFGHPMEDGLLTMSLACAFVCWQAAARSGRFAPLLVAGVFVGIGFQAKMAQAWLVLPALVVGVLLLPGRRRTRLARAGALLAAGVVASLAWTVAIQLVPADRRPYVDGTTDNSTLTMVLGFNGLDRMLPGSVPGAVHDPASQTTQVGTVHLGTGPVRGLFKLVGYADVSQVGWLYPLAFAGIVGAALDARRSRRRARAPADGADPARGPTLIALVLWLGVAVVVLSLAHVPHTAYLAAIGVAIAVLVGAGLDGVLSGLRSGATRARRWALAAVVTQVVWSAVVLVGYGGIPGALGAILVGAGVLAAVGALAAVLAPPAVPARVLTAVVLVGVLLTPAVWTGLVIDVHDNGSASDAYAGPREAANPVLAARAPSSLTRFAPGAPWRGPNPTPDRTARALAAYLSQRAPAAGGTVLLTDYWGSAASQIVWFGIDARAVGGFSGEVPDVTPADLSTMIQAGRLPFALVHDSPTVIADRSVRKQSAVVRADDDIVRSLCRAVPGAWWDRGYPLVGETLYDCRR